MSNTVSNEEVGIGLLLDHQWRWIETLPDPEDLSAPSQTLRIVERPAELGHYPIGYHPATSSVIEVTFRPAESYVDGIKKVGLDMRGSYGTITAAGESALALIMSWPYPEFMLSDPTVSDLFIRTLDEGEAPDAITKP